MCAFPYRHVYPQHALEGTGHACPELWLLQGCKDRVELLFLSRVLKGFSAGWDTLSLLCIHCSNAVSEKASWELGWDVSELPCCLGRERRQSVRFRCWDHSLKVSSMSLFQSCFNCCMGYVWFSTHLTDPLSILEQRLVYMEPIYTSFSRKQCCAENSWLTDKTWQPWELCWLP